MIYLELSRHAAVRCQQRCVPPLIIEWLLSYGRRESSFGAVKVRFDGRARKDLAKDVGERVLSLMSKYLSVAVVVDRNTDEVITVEWLR
jgi:hypothetical protein